MRPRHNALEFAEIFFRPRGYIAASKNDIVVPTIAELPADFRVVANPEKLDWPELLRASHEAAALVPAEKLSNAPRNFGRVRDELKDMGYSTQDIVWLLLRMRTAIVKTMAADRNAKGANSYFAERLPLVDKMTKPLGFSYGSYKEEGVTYGMPLPEQFFPEIQKRFTFLVAADLMPAPTTLWDRLKGRGARVADVIRPAMKEPLPH